MTEEQINILGLWIFVPSAAVAFTLVLMAVLGSIRGFSPRRREQQLARLDAELRDQGLDASTLDWVRFKDVSKQELIDVMAHRGWYYADQEVRGQHWMLRFARNRAPRQANTGHDPRQRLRAELDAAQTGIDGTYPLDTTSYGKLERSEVLQLVRAAGWHEVRPGGDGVSYVAPLTAESVENPVSFLRGPSLVELRANPHVVHRANILEGRYGFDPLSADVANHARQRHNHYYKLIQRNVLLALLYATVTLIGVVVTFGVSVASDGSSWYMPMLVTLIMVGLFGMSLGKIRVFSRQRRREIGDFIVTYRELQQLHHGDLSASARG